MMASDFGYHVIYQMSGKITAVKTQFKEVKTSSSVSLHRNLDFIWTLMIHFMSESKGIEREAGKENFYEKSHSLAKIFLNFALQLTQFSVGY